MLSVFLDVALTPIVTFVSGIDGFHFTVLLCTNGGGIYLLIKRVYLDDCTESKACKRVC